MFLAVLVGKGTSVQELLRLLLILVVFEMKLHFVNSAQGT